MYTLGHPLIRYILLGILPAVGLILRLLCSPIGNRNFRNITNERTPQIVSLSILHGSIFCTGVDRLIRSTRQTHENCDKLHIFFLGQKNMSTRDPFNLSNPLPIDKLSAVTTFTDSCFLLVSFRLRLSLGNVTSGRQQIPSLRVPL